MFENGLDDFLQDLFRPAPPPASQVTPNQARAIIARQLMDLAVGMRAYARLIEKNGPRR